MQKGHEVRATDIVPPVFERPEPDDPEYIQADLSDAGDMFAVARGMDAVVDAAALPEPTHNPPYVVFHNNLMGVFNTLEAAIRFEVPRFVNISSETVPGFFFPEREFLPDYAPVDEDHPIRPQDPYATAKYFGELLMDAAVRRSDIRAISIRPSWVQHEGNCEHNLGPQVRDASELSPNLWSCMTSTTSRTRSCWPSRATCPATRSSTSRAPTTPAAGRSGRSSRSTTATR